MNDFESIIKSLLDGGVDFVIIGGLAAAVHGCSILTQDVDICASFDAENLDKLFDAIKGFNPKHRQSKKDLEPDLNKFKNLYLITDLGSLDILNEVLNIGNYSQVKAHSVEIDLFEKRCRVLDVKGLIRSKEAMGRPKDKETISQLKAISDKIES